MKEMSYDKARTYSKKAEEWSKSKLARTMFSGSRSSSKCAYAEALANADGYTFWPHLYVDDDK